MATIESDLDRCQRFLGDASTIGEDGQIWTRAELLDWYQDGYRQLLLQSQGTRRWTVLPIPPRWTASGTQPWESRFAWGGTWWQWTHQALGYGASSLWEVETLEGLTPTAASEGLSHGWERAHVNPTHVPFRFGLPRDHGRIVKLWYDHKLLLPVDTRELDATETQWISLAGEPLAWTLGTGRNRTIEVYEIVTVYTSTDYAYSGAYFGLGTARSLSGSRTYTASYPGQSLPYGLIRSVDSTERQYLTLEAPPVGVIREWGSSVDNLLCLEVIGPAIAGLTEADTPVLVPPQLAKYLRAYTLYRAFNRTGEGYQPALALFFEQRFARGVQVMRTLSMLSRRDHQWARQPERGRTRPPRPRLPSSYPRVRR